MSFNQAQQEAVSHNEGPCLVLAGPGSGKTLTIVGRIQKLIQTYHVSPEEILVITFTKYAAVEMKNRFFSAMKGTRPAVTFGTFHGIYYGILKWAYRFGPENILSEEEKRQMLLLIVNRKEIDEFEEEDFLKEIISEIGIVKNNGLKIEEYETTICGKETFREIYREYERKRNEERKIDFDDMLLLCGDLFIKRPDILKKWQEKFRYILIDEFQDTSRMQWDNFRLLLLEGLSQGADSLIVGDVKQSIYRWRNGDWGILNGLKTNIEAFPVKVKTLTTNRRSAANIIHFNNEVFTAACEVLNNIYKEEQKKECKELKEAYNDVCQETYKDPGKGYVKVEFLSDTEDMTYMENTLHHLGEEVELLVAQGVQLKDIAILVRKNRSIPLIADYFDKNTSYKIVSDEAFRLDASLAVCMIMDGLRYLSQPENRIAKAQPAAAYQNEVLHKGIDLNTLLLNGIDDYLPFDFIKEAEQLRLMPQ